MIRLAPLQLADGGIMLIYKMLNPSEHGLGEMKILPALGFEPF